jgi:hypothetical protein
MEPPEKQGAKQMKQYMGHFKVPVPKAALDEHAPKSAKVFSRRYSEPNPPIQSCQFKFNVGRKNSLQPSTSYSEGTYSIRSASNSSLSTPERSPTSSLSGSPYTSPSESPCNTPPRSPSPSQAPHPRYQRLQIRRTSLSAEGILLKCVCTRRLKLVYVS